LVGPHAIVAAHRRECKQPLLHELAQEVMHVDVDGGFLGDNGRVLLAAILSQFDPEATIHWRVQPVIYVC